MEKSKIQLAKEKCENLLKFFTEKQEDKVELKFETVKVKDSDTLLEYSELVKGADVNISTSNGSAPASDGNYQLVNGAEISVKGGKIDSIVKEPDAPVEDKPEDKPEEEKLADTSVEDKTTEEAKPADDKNDLSDLENRISQIEDAIKSILEVISQAPSAQEVQDFNSKIEALAKTPTQLSADTRAEIKNSEDDKYKRVASLFYKSN